MDDIKDSVNKFIADQLHLLEIEKNVCLLLQYYGYLTCHQLSSGRSRGGNDITANTFHKRTRKKGTLPNTLKGDRQ